MDVTISVALIGIVSGFVVFLARRVGDLEGRLNALDQENDLLWFWNRQLIDLYYRWRKDGAPDPPLPPDGTRGTRGSSHGSH